MESVFSDNNSKRFHAQISTFIDNNIRKTCQTCGESKMAAIARTNGLRTGKIPEFVAILSRIRHRNVLTPRRKLINFRWCCKWNVHRTKELIYVTAAKRSFRTSQINITYMLDRRSMRGNIAFRLCISAVQYISGRMLKKTYKEIHTHLPAIKLIYCISYKYAWLSKVTLKLSICLEHYLRKIA